MKQSDAWRIMMGLGASLVLATAVYAVGIPYPYEGCAICKSALPEWLWWMCALECLFN
jgi:hypothetical protein